MYIILLIALTLCAQIQATQTLARPSRIPIEVPTLLGAGEEQLTTSELGAYLTLETFAQLIAEKHNRNSSYLLARVVTQDQHSHFYINYFDAHEFCQYLNLFTTEEEDIGGHYTGGRPLSPPGLTGRNALMYHPFRHTRFFPDSLNHLPITLGVHYFILAKGASTFTYFCSHEDLFINRALRDTWRKFFQENEKNKSEAEQAILKNLSEHTTIFPPIHTTDASSVVVHIPPEMGAEDALKLAAQDPITKKTFARLINESHNNAPYIIVRFAYQDNNGNYHVSYCDAHAFNTTYFGGYPLTKNTANALLYQGSLASLSNAPETKYFYAVQERGQAILNHNILYFSYDPSSPRDGFTFLCSHFDLFISEPTDQDYWTTVLEANQNSNEKLKKQALAKLKEAAFQKKENEVKKIAAVRKQRQELKEDALSLIFAEISEATRTEALQRALTVFNQQLMALTQLSN